MTQWLVAHGDILDVAADGLICSANGSLNLSGGVGAAIALRYGDAMQEYLHQYLQEHGLRYIQPGEAVVAPASGSSYAAVAHAVGIDAFYDTDANLILQTYVDAIEKLSAAGCRTIAAACLGCGYGRFSAAEFAGVARELAKLNFEKVEQITLVTTNESLAETIRLQFQPG